MLKCMKKGVNKYSPLKITLIVVGAFFLFLFMILPLSLLFFNGAKIGNVALIPIEGPLTVNGGSVFGQQSVSSETIVKFIEEAEENSAVKVIVLEINSPGGSAVASDEIAIAIKETEKPVIALIREVGASGGYWIASATDHIIANRMAITGSIGVISSYIEFSELMNRYGIGYERLVAGELKDVGTPFRKLKSNEKAIFQSKIDTIHDYFIQEIANNRKMESKEVKKLATGEFFLGVEALDLGLVDQLGGKKELETYIKGTHQLEEVNYVSYERQIGLFDALAGVISDFSFKIGEGIGTIFVKGNGNQLLI